MTKVKLTLNTDLIRRAAADELDNALFQAGSVIAAEIRIRAPRRSGSMAESVYVSTEQHTTYQTGGDHEKERKPGKGTVVVGVASFRGHFFEAGTSKMPARPFVRPALAAKKAEAARAAVDFLRKRLDGIG